MHNKETGLIFKKSFKAPKETDIFKPCMEGFSDPTLADFTPLSSTTTNKAEIRRIATMEEWVNSYREAAKQLSVRNQERCIGTKAARQNKNADYELPWYVEYAFYSFYFTPPAVFLARHAVELTIKEAMEKISDSPQKPIHNLISLWDSLVSNFPKGPVPFDRKTIKEIRRFLEIISLLDDDGTKVRYPFDRDGNYTQKEFVWVNCLLLSEFLDDFVDTLRSIDYKYVRAAKK